MSQINLTMEGKPIPKTGLLQQLSNPRFQLDLSNGEPGIIVLSAYAPGGSEMDVPLDRSAAVELIALIAHAVSRMELEA